MLFRAIGASELPSENRRIVVFHMINPQAFMQSVAFFFVVFGDGVYFERLVRAHRALHSSEQAHHY